MGKEKRLLDFDNAVILLLIISIFIIMKAALNPAPSLESLEQEAGIILNKLTGGNELNLLNSNEIVEEKVRLLDRMDYNEVKTMLGVKNDFCIYFEDATGSIVRIDGISPGIGSDKISIDGEPCR